MPTMSTPKMTAYRPTISRLTRVVVIALICLILLDLLIGAPSVGQRPMPSRQFFSGPCAGGAPLPC